MLLLQAMFMTSLASLHVLLSELSWWFAGAAASAVVLGVATFARSRMRRPVWPSIFAILAGVMLLTGLYAPQTAILGLIPTPDTGPALFELIRSGAQSISEQSVPADPAIGIVMLIVVLMILLAWFGEVFLVAQTPALVALPIAGILVIPVAVRSGLADPLWFVATVVLYLVFLRVGRRADSRRIVAFVGVAVLAGALVAPAVMPPVRPAVPGVGTGFRTGVNPLVSLGDDLRRGAPIRILSYTADALDPVYLRLATMEDFSGDRWEPTPADAFGLTLDEFGQPPGLSDDVAREIASASVEVGAFSSRWLPVPYPATAVSGLEGDFAWLEGSLAVRAGESSARGQSYEVEYLELSPTAEQLVRGGGDPASDQALELPGLPEIIERTAVEVAGAAATPYQQAIALQSYLRASPFRYSEETPVDEGFDGTGVDAIATFLEVKSGYCVHYASAMAVMARTLGIPTRLAVGFQPGSQRVVDGVSEYVLTTDDLHAWPELYIGGVGWMRFEPTPGRGALPAAVPLQEDDPTTPEDESTAAPTAAPAPTSTARPDRPQDSERVDPEVAAAQSAQGVAALVLAGIVVVAAIPALFRAGVRWGRLRRIRRGIDPAAAAWDELRDTARDHGWSAPEWETPRVFAERLSVTVDDEHRALSAFRASVESSAFGRSPHVLTPAELHGARRAIIESSGLRTRLRALALPASLLYRWRPDDDGRSG